MEDCKQKLKEKEDEINILKRNVTEMNTKCMKIQNENATLSNDIKQLNREYHLEIERYDQQYGNKYQ